MTLLARIAALVLVLVAASGCATTGRGETTGNDPWEGMNRGIYSFNDTLDKAILKPVAKGYDFVLPGFAKEGVNNFFSNLDDIAVSINNIAQGKPGQGISDAGRFVINSVFGIFGLWDVATPLGLEKHDEDFGQTLAVWGMNSGPYLMLPLFGPSTLRDGPAKVVTPSWAYSHWWGSDTSWGLFGLDVVRSRANLFKAESVLEEAALDKYSFIRDVWVQRRRNLIYDGNPPRPKEED